MYDNKLDEIILKAFLKQTSPEEEVDVMPDGETPVFLDDVTGNKYLVVGQFDSITKVGDRYIIDFGYCG